MQDPLPPLPYFVFLSRAPDRPLTQVWPVALKERLPTVPVPLLPGDPAAAGETRLTQHLRRSAADPPPASASGDRLTHLRRPGLIQLLIR